MDNISGWVRQARHRAKKHGVPSYLTTEEATEVVSYYGGLCAYCSERDAVTLDHAMPVVEDGPNVQANILPCCRHCKFVKRNRSLVWMFSEGLISEELYMGRISQMLLRGGSSELRTIMRRDIGLIGGHNG